jgi:hypothetical protein
MFRIAASRVLLFEETALAGFFSRKRVDYFFRSILARFVFHINIHATVRRRLSH